MLFPRERVRFLQSRAPFGSHFCFRAKVTRKCTVTASQAAPPYSRPGGCWSGSSLPRLGGTCPWQTGQVTREVFSEFFSLAPFSSVYYQILPHRQMGENAEPNAGVLDLPFGFFRTVLASLTARSQTETLLQCPETGKFRWGWVENETPKFKQKRPPSLEKIV